MGESPHWMASHAEEKAHPLVRKPPMRAKWIRHTNRFLSRVYPGPVRVDSSNMDPLPFWAAGVQLVALNFQRPDTTPMQLNTGMPRSAERDSLRPAITLRSRPTRMH